MKISCLPFRKLQVPSMIEPTIFVPLTITDIEERNIPLEEVNVCPELYNMPFLNMQSIINQELIPFYLERIAFIKSKWRFYCKKTGSFVTTEIANISNDRQNEYIDTLEFFSYLIDNDGEKIDLQTDLKITLNKTNSYDEDAYVKFFKDCTETIDVMKFFHRL